MKPAKSLSAALKRSLFYVALFYTALLVIMFFSQRDFIYYPDKRAHNHAAMTGNLRPVHVKTSDGLSLTGLYLPPSEPGSKVIVLFHGNGGRAADRLFKAGYFTKDGYGVLLAEYRGYGGNEGQPSEQGLYNDARAYLAYLMEAEGIAAQDIILYGESLGSAVAVQMATEITPGALILESPFSSMVDLAKQIYWFLPVELLLQDKYESLGKIASLEMPLLIVHGARDDIVPPAHAAALFEAASEPKTLHIIEEAGHNDLYARQAPLHIRRFLRTIEGRD